MSWRLALPALLALSGCIQIDGGAAELSWSLRTFSGDTLKNGCADADIPSIRLCWAPLADGGSVGDCEPGFRRTFVCDEFHGVTSFELPIGPNAFWIEPLCADGGPSAAGTFQVPAPIVRDVADGEVVTLSSLLVVVTDNSKAQPVCPAEGCTCVR